MFLNRGKDSQGEEVIKPYTPTTLDSDVGHFELVIKVFIRKFSACGVHCSLVTCSVLGPF